MNNYTYYSIDNINLSETEFLALCNYAKKLRPDLFNPKRDCFPRQLAKERLNLFRKILNLN